VSAPADRNLLFGILAVQLDFINKDALIAAMNAWVIDKSSPLGDILRDQGQLSAERLQLLTALVAEHLKQHGGDPQRSLGALTSIELTLKQQLAALPDSAVQASLVQVSADRTLRADPLGTVAQPTSAAPTPGRYRILRPHARGGLGEIFVAEDTELGRQVALKQIQDRHANDQSSRGRFVFEAEVTGGLEHPGIVPVYGLGTYADGRPFYAMRFIKGDNLKDAIASFHGEPVASATGGRPNTPVANAPGPSRFESLEFRQLLRRFVDVCNAVVYAHSRGVLHRDLKPGNIMLGKYGETLVVDWGLAKSHGSRNGAVRERETDGDPTLIPRSGGASSATVAGAAMGTPAYMPPEQANGEIDKLGPASDIYSLGATMYELLTGRAPFRGDSANVFVAVRNSDFPSPRRVNPAIPQSLDAVCLKAMALKPENRYATALDLAKEIEQSLADEPVAAWREPAAVRARRWVRRHSRLVTGLTAALIVGVVGAVAGLYFVNEERNRTEVARKNEADRAEGERLAKISAEENLAYAKKGNELLGSVFAKLDPRRIAESGRPLQDVLKDNLTHAVKELEGSAIGDPLSVAAMQNTLGESLRGLGQYQQAIVLFEKARATRAAKLGPDHPSTLISMNSLALGYGADGQLDRALPLMEETLKLRKAKLGPDHSDTLMSMNNLATGYLYAGRLDQALPLLEETLKLSKSKLGPDHADTVMSMNNLANGYTAAGRLDQALPLLEETLKLSKAKLGPDHPSTLISMNSLAFGYSSTGRLDQARSLLEETLKLQKAKLGPDHPDTLITMNNLAEGYSATGQFDRAVPLYEETLKLTKGKLGPDHPSTLGSMNNLAQGYSSTGRLDQALPLLEETLKLCTAKLGPDHPNTLMSMNNLASGYKAAGRLDQALPLLEETLKLRKAKLGPDHPDTLKSVGNLAVGYQAAGKLDAAEPLFREVAEVAKRKSGDTSPPYASALANLGSNLIAQTKWADAEPLLRSALAIREKSQPDAWTTFAAQSLLGASLLGQNKFADAEPLLVAGYEGMKAREAKIPPAAKVRVKESVERLVSFYEATGKAEEAAKWREKLPR
jgi:tetratricopeptide (TPR) repeat protein